VVSPDVLESRFGLGRRRRRIHQPAGTRGSVSQPAMHTASSRRLFKMNVVVVIFRTSQCMRLVEQYASSQVARPADRPWVASGLSSGRLAIAMERLTSTANQPSHCLRGAWRVFGRSGTVVRKGMRMLCSSGPPLGREEIGAGQVRIALTAFAMAMGCGR
jgi:hypothetical protein